MANDGKRFIKGSGIAKHREWDAASRIHSMTTRSGS